MRSNRIDPNSIDRMCESWSESWSLHWSSGDKAFVAQVSEPRVRDVAPIDHTRANAAVAASNICNAPEVVDWIGHNTSSSCKGTDAALINHTYKHRGLDGLRRLDGDFAAAIWDEEKQQMHCIRDHFGQQPLFYFHTEHVFLFASSISILLAHPDVPRRPNLQALASLTTDPSGRLTKDRTFFNGIKSVLPASVLSVSRSRVREKRFWSPGESNIDRGRNEQEHLGEIADRFTTAVSSRIPRHGPAIALLSGGLDSSGIVAVGANTLAAQDRQLITLSAVKEFTSSDGLQEEESFINCFSDVDNIDMHLVRSSGRGPFDHFESVVKNSSGPLVSSRHYLYSAFAEKASKLGGYSVFDGLLGELGPTYRGPGIMLEWLARGNWTRLWREINATASVNQSGIWAVIRSQLLRQLLMPKMKPDFLSTVNLFNAEFIQANTPVGAPSQSQMSASVFDHRALQLQYLANAQKTSRVAGFEGFKKVSFCKPYLDRRLLELCVSAPGSVKHRNGYNRYLLRAILKNVLPEPIRLRTTKAPFSVDYHLRYNRQREIVQNYVGGIGLKDPVRQVINVGLLEKRMAETAMDGVGKEASSANALHFVTSAIYSIAFLRQFSEFS